MYFTVRQWISLLITDFKSIILINITKQKLSLHYLKTQSYLLRPELDEDLDLVPLLLDRFELPELL